MVKSVITSEKAFMGSELVTFDQGEEVQMLLQQSREEREMYGGDRPERSLSASAEAGVVPSYVETGSILTARGVEWKVSTVERGASMDSLSLIDPYRID